MSRFVGDFGVPVTAIATTAASALAPGAFLTARWERLAMINYEVDPALLRERVPPGVELDTWSARCFVSMVGFLFLDTRVLGLPIPFHRDFEEVNLRFYVRRRGAPDGDRRGVVFVKELVPRWAIATVANTVYNERYQSLPMRHRIEWPDDDARDVEFGWRLGGRWNRLRVAGEGVAAIPSPGSEEEFITEHYWGYAGQRDGGCVEYRVEHPQWRVWKGATAELDCDVERLYGREFVSVLAAKPTSAFIAEGSPVVVRRGVRIA